MESLKQKLHNFWTINWLRRSLISGMILLLILAVIPLIIQYSIPHLLVKQGAREASIEDINLNLFAGTFELKQMSITTGSNKPAKIQHIVADIRMLDLFSGKLVINELLFKGIHADIRRDDKGEISINGLVLPAPATEPAENEAQAEAESEPLNFAINKFSLTDSELNYQEPGFSQQARLNSISVNNIKSWEPENNASLAIDLLINNSPFKLTAVLNLFDKVQRIRGTGSITSLPFTPYEKFYRAQLDKLSGTVSLNSEFDIELSDAISAQLQNTVQIDGLEVNYQTIQQRVKQITWSGKTDVLNNGGFAVSGDLNIYQNQTRDKQQDYLISSFDQLKITQLQHQGQSIRFADLTLDQLLLINTEKKNSFVDLQKLDIKNLGFEMDSAQLNIDAVTLYRPQARVTLTKNKELLQLTPLLKSLQTLTPASDQPPAKEKTNDRALAINVRKIVLAEPGQVKFKDNSVSPEYQTNVQLNQINIKNLSSTDKSEFEVALKQGEYTQIDITGEGLLFNPAENLQLNADIKQLDLSPMTPYTSQVMGYGMKSGVVDSTIKVALKKRIIDSEVKLKIDSIEVVETNKETAEQVSSASGMSIDLAISTLKDKLNIIDLKLPVSGSIDKPDFDLSLIVNKAMGKAMKSATFAYLKHTLQPFGSLVTLFSLAKKAANHISLPPVMFHTNSIELKQDQQELLDKVVRLLNERPGLKIKACGISALEDQQAIKKTLIDAEIARLKAEKAEADKKQGNKPEGKKVETIVPGQIEIAPELIQQKMRELADRRSARIKAVFLEQGKLESNRILNCLSSSNIAEKSRPSVELLI